MGGCCNKADMVKGTRYRIDYNKKRDSATEYVCNECFVEFINADGTMGCFTPMEEVTFQALPDEILRINLETIDQRRSSLEISASEEVVALKQKVCEIMSFSDILMIFQGKVLKLEEEIGRCIPQGCTLDIIPV